MSGGSYNYIQTKDASEFLESAALTQEIDYVALTLKDDYGEAGHLASDASYAVCEKIRAARDQIATILKDIDADIDVLRAVWRQVDYHGSMDVSKEQVIEELEKYNASRKA